MTVVGVVGGGQLARMMIPAAINLGIDIVVFAETEGSSARVAVTHVGDYTVLDQLESFASTVDVLTFDHEHVPLEHLEALERKGMRVYPPSQALALTHDKTVMRKALLSLGIPQPQWAVVTSHDSTNLESIGGFPCIAKLPVGGYDGKGVRLIQAWEEIEDWLALGPVLLEERVNFARELAQLGARNPSGEWKTWSPVETRQREGVCAQVLSPAPGLSESAVALAGQLAEQIAEAFHVVGVLAVELFETEDGNLLVNELAMRPHNSGHVFTEHSVTSQFEQHLRAVTDSRLGSTDFHTPAGAMVNIFGAAEFDSWQQLASDYPEVKLHSYQKPARAGRKAGHLVVTGPDADLALSIAMSAAEVFEGEVG